MLKYITTLLITIFTITSANALDHKYGGFVTAFGAYTDPDQITQEQEDKKDFIADSEAWLILKQKFGILTLGGYIQLETEADSALKEGYLFVQTEMLRIEAGRTKNIAEKLHIAIPDASGMRFNRKGYVYKMFDYQNVTPVSSTALTTDEHTQKVSIVTAPYYGFQIGGSYIPGSYNGGGADLDRTKDFNTFKNGYAGTLRYTYDNGYRNFAWSAGYLELNGMNEFRSDPIGYLYFSSDRRQEYSSGINVGWGNITLGLSGRIIKETDPIAVDGITNSQDGFTVAAGMGYNFLKTSTTLSYQKTETEGDVTNEEIDTTEIFQFSTKYTAKKGFDIWTAIGQVNFIDETKLPENGQKGMFWSVGTTLTF